MFPIIYSTAPFWEVTGPVAGRANKTFFRILAERGERVPKGLKLNQGVIVVPQRFQQCLTAQELAVVIAHEQGHVHLGHVYHFAEESNKVEVVPEFELQADAYAVAQGHSAAFVLQTLRRLVTVLAEIIVQHPRAKHGLTQEVAEKVIHQHMQYRYDALQAMIAA